MTRLVEHHGLLGVEERAIAVDALNAEEEQAKSRIRGAENDLAQKQHEATVLTASLLDLRGAVEVQENGLYDFEHPAEDSIALATRLEAVRSRIKDAVRGGRATQASNSFTFNNSEAQGRKFVRDMSKLMLRSYNAEAENWLFGHPVGSWGEAAGGEEHAESVVLAVAETASEAAV